jgi:hypothetical protein
MDTTSRPVLNLEAPTACSASSREIGEFRRLGRDEISLKRAESGFGFFQRHANIARGRRIPAAAYDQDSVCAGLLTCVSEFDRQQHAHMSALPLEMPCKLRLNCYRPHRSKRFQPAV